MPLSSCGHDVNCGPNEDLPSRSPLLRAYHPRIEPRRSPPPFCISRGPMFKGPPNQGDAILIHYLDDGLLPAIANRAGAEDFSYDSDVPDNDSDGSGSVGGDGQQERHVHRDEGNIIGSKYAPAYDGPVLLAPRSPPVTSTELNLQTLAEGALSALTSDKDESVTSRPDPDSGPVLASLHPAFPQGAEPRLYQTRTHQFRGRSPGRAQASPSLLHLGPSQLPATTCPESGMPLTLPPPTSLIRDTRDLPLRLDQGRASYHRYPMMEFLTPAPSPNDTSERLARATTVASARHTDTKPRPPLAQHAHVMPASESHSARRYERIGTAEPARDAIARIPSSPLRTTLAALTLPAAMAASSPAPRADELPPLHQPEIGSHVLLPPLRSLNGFASFDGEPPLPRHFSNPPRASTALTDRHAGATPPHVSPLSPSHLASSVHVPVKSNLGISPLPPAPMHSPQSRPAGSFSVIGEAPYALASSSGGECDALSVPTPASPSTPATPNLMTIDSITAPSFACQHPGCKAPPFSTHYLLNSHANVHSSNRPHYCPVRECPRGAGGLGFKRKNEMIRHGLVHQSPGYVCPFCPDRDHKYPRPDNLQRHVRVYHPTRNKDDQLLRDVLAQRPEGQPYGRRRRGISNTS